MRTTKSKYSSPINDKALDIISQLNPVDDKLKKKNNKK